MKSRKSKQGWVVTGPGREPFSQYDENRFDLYLFGKRQDAIDNSTGGSRDDKWWTGCQKNGYRVRRVRVTVSELDG